jgi:hypothetical protein
MHLKFIQHNNIETVWKFDPECPVLREGKPIQVKDLREGDKVTFYQSGTLYDSVAVLEKKVSILVSTETTVSPEKVLEELRSVYRRYEYTLNFEIVPEAPPPPPPPAPQVRNRWAEYAEDE